MMTQDPAGISGTVFMPAGTHWVPNFKKNQLPAMTPKTKVS